MEFTEEMLDAIEAVKGVSNPDYWDPRCKRYMERNKTEGKEVKEEEKR